MPTAAEPTLAQILLSPPGWWASAAFVFAFGLILGSFLNVAIYRMPLGLSVNRPRRSFCFRCGTHIRWHDNIPVLSWFLLRGRCRACGAGFSPRYAMVELLTGVVFVSIFAVFNRPGAESFAWGTPWYLAFAALLIVGAFTDLDHWILPKGVAPYGTAAALLAALACGFLDPLGLVGSGGPFPAVRLAHGGWEDAFLALIEGPRSISVRPSEVLWWEPPANALLGAVLAPLVLYGVGVVGKVIFRKDAMGFGDVQLFALIGATVGPINSLLVLMAASVVGTIAGGIGWIAARAGEGAKNPLRFGAEAPDLFPPEPTAATDGGEDEEADRARSLAESLEMEFSDLATARPTAEALAAIPAELAERWNALPLAISGDRLRVAIPDPLNTRLVMELREAAGRELDFVIAPMGAIAEARRRALAGEAPAPAADGEPPWRRYVRQAALAPATYRPHHLPFIPWIAAGALLVLLFNPFM